MNLSPKTLIAFVASLLILAGAGFILYRLSANVFFSIGWFILLSSLLSSLTTPLVRKSTKMLVWAAALVMSTIWFIFNDALFLLISTSVNSNPYGEYFLGQFEFRLLLSIFVLKAILKMWLTDARLLLAGFLVIAHFALLAPAIRFVLMAIPSRFFEFVIHTGSILKIELRRYFTTSLGLSLVNSALWCLAAFLLQFDNYILVTFIMLLFSFIPRIGLFVGAALSLLFVESGLFLIQLGGMLIALASMWFVDHTFFKDQDLFDKSIPLFVLALLPAAGYIVAGFWGLFLTAPLVYISAVCAKNISKNTLLVHKIPPSRPRNA